MSAATRIINKYLELIHACNGDVSRLGVSVAIPVFSEKTIVSLCEEYMYYSDEQPTISINHDIIVVGDLHGELHNCIAIFNKFGYPPKQRYLFLGNITEFGEYSLELLTLLLSYNILYPTSVYVLRGSTESVALGIYRGLKSDIEGNYQSLTIYEKFIDVFSVMPFSALVLNCIFCCQPGTIAKHKSAEEVKTSKTQIDIPHDDAAYNHLVSLFDEKVDDEKIERFIDNSNLEFLIMGGCPDDRFCDSVGKALYITASTDEFGCVAPIVFGRENEIAIFETIEAVHRNKAKFAFIKDQIMMSASKKSIIIPQIGSRPQLKKITTPANRSGILPAKSLAKIIPLADFVV